MLRLIKEGKSLQNIGSLQGLFHKVNEEYLNKKSCLRLMIYYFCRDLINEIK